MQTLKTAVEAAAMLLRIDDIVSGLGKKEKQGGGGGGPGPQVEDPNQVSAFHPHAVVFLGTPSAQCWS